MPEETKLSLTDVFHRLEGWKHLVQLERDTGEIFEGTIKGLSQEAGTLEFSTRVRGGGQQTWMFDLSNADFERFNELEEWEEVFVVYPHSSPDFTLRKFK